MSLSPLTNKPKRFVTPWMDDEEADLHRLLQIYGRDVPVIREEMAKLGWLRSDQAIENRIQRAFPKTKGFSIPKKGITMPDEIEMLALHKPWRK